MKCTISTISSSNSSIQCQTYITIKRKEYFCLCTFYNRYKQTKNQNWSSPSKLDIGSWYVTQLPTPPRTLQSWIITAISLVNSFVVLFLGWRRINRRNRQPRSWAWIWSSQALHAPPFYSSWVSLYLAA